MGRATPGVLDAVERRIRNEASSVWSTSSQDSLPNIRNIQTDKLRVVEWVKPFGKAQHLLPHYWIKKLDLSTIMGSEGKQRDDINSAFRRHLINHITSGITARLTCKSSTQPPRNF